jgi:hypothetical protein
MSKNPAEMDIHNIRRRYENAIRNLEHHSGICGENKEKIMEFLGHCSAQDLSIARRLFYLQRLTIIAAILGDKRFVDTSRTDVESILSQIGDRMNKTGEPLTAWTKLGYKITVRVFWRWMRRCGEDENPPETSWIRTKRTKDSKILPEQLLTKEDVLKIPPQILACPWATQYARNLQRTSTNTNANGGQMNLGPIRFVPSGYTQAVDESRFLL